MATRKKKTREGGRLAGVGRSTAEAVRRASEVLEGELAAGVAAARQAEARLRREKKLDAADLEEVLARFRADGHELVDVVREMSAELRSAATGALSERALTDAHGALDTVLDLVTLTPDLVNRLMQMADTALAANGGASRASDAKGKGKGRQPEPPARSRRRRTAR